LLWASCLKRMGGQMTKTNESLDGEALRHDCFLCRPSATLLVHVGTAGYAIAGLGPLADGYTVVATQGHLQGLAAASTELRTAYSDYTETLAKALTARYGACFIVEHGNMAVCGIEAEGRAHCFHPHFLLVPDARCSLDPFNEYFGSGHQMFDSLIDAVSFGADRGQYVLAGQFPGPFAVYLPQGELPRQFARALLAEQLGVDDRASWRAMPDLRWTCRNAISVRDAIRS